LSHAKNLVFANGIQSKQFKKKKPIVIQIRHKKIESRCNLLWWFVSNVWLWVDQEPY